MVAPRVATLRCGFEKGFQSLWAWLTVGMTEQFTGARGVYGGPRSPFLSPSWFMVHTVHRTTVPAPPLASPHDGVPAGGEWPFSSHGGSSAAFVGSTEDFSARPCPVRWPVQLGTLSA